ncbi:MAG: Crp/Fnr family transcriptional regulator [Nitrospinota bacterium]
MRFILSMIRGTPFFYDLTAEEFKDVARKIVVHGYKPETSVLLERQQKDSIFFVTKGVLQSTVCDPDTGSSLTLGQFSKGSFFGEVSLLTGRPNPVTISALTECELFEIPGAAYKRAALKYSSARGFLINLYKQHSEKLLRAFENHRFERRKLRRKPFDGSIIFQRFEKGSKEKVIKVGKGRLLDISETGVSFSIKRSPGTCRLSEMLNREYKAKITVADLPPVKVLGKIVGFEFSVRGEKFYDSFITRMAFLFVDKNDKMDLKELLALSPGTP